MPAAVTLDPATAQPQILMSPDGWAAGCQELPPAPLPSGMEHLCCVLGWPGFVGGWHSWAVKVHPAPDWALGVVREFVSRKGCFGLSPEVGFGLWGSGWGSCRLSPGPAPCLCPTTNSDTLKWLWITLAGRWLSMMLIARLKSLLFPSHFHR